MFKGNIFPEIPDLHSAEKKTLDLREKFRPLSNQGPKNLLLTENPVP